MRQHLLSALPALGADTVTTDETGNIYATKGSDPILPYPTLIAHMDTVHRIVPDDQFSIVEINNALFGFNPKTYDWTGIGGDDKVGIFIALSALTHMPRIKLAFFVDEEIGCLGSRRADMDFFNDSAFVLQCDRKGYGDFVQEILGTELFGAEFKDAISPIIDQYRFETTDRGGITDVGELKENGLAVACANLSCGYYRPHLSSEFVYLPDVEDTLHLVLDLFDQLGDATWPHEAPPPAYTYAKYGAVHGAWQQPLRALSPTTTKTKATHRDFADCPACGNHDTLWDPDQKAYYCFVCDDYLVDEDAFLYG